MLLLSRNGLKIEMLVYKQTSVSTALIKNKQQQQQQQNNSKNKQTKTSPQK